MRVISLLLILHVFYVQSSHVFYFLPTTLWAYHIVIQVIASCIYIKKGCIQNIYISAISTTVAPIKSQYVHSSF